MKTADFEFDLPPERIALRPASPRSAARLLLAERDGLTDSRFSRLQDHLRSGDRLVFNDTRVLPVYLRGIRQRSSPTGTTAAHVEATLLSFDGQECWHALAKPGRRLREGDRIFFGEAFCAEVVRKSGAGVALKFNVCGKEFDDALAVFGNMPLPPYIASRRPADLRDFDDYQTIFAERPGAVAAPTASLHFDARLMDSLRVRGVGISRVTLHVGAGTFMPVSDDMIASGRLHAESGEISESAAEEIRDTKRQGGRVIPVGTTVLRLLETAAAKDSARGEVQPWRGQTDIFIKPGFQFMASDALVTNFHLPGSSLIMLVAAFVGLERTRELYSHAISRHYRFYSYGDGSLLVP